MSAIKFGRAASGSSGGSGSVDIETILAQVHKHTNKDIIDKFGLNGEVLYFNEKPIINSAGNILASSITEAVDRKFLSGTEKTSLTGIKDNIQNTLDILKNSLLYVGTFESYASLTSTVKNPNQGNIAFVNKDENFNYASTVYVYTSSSWKMVHKNITNETTSSILNKFTVDKNAKLLWDGKSIGSSIDETTASIISKFTVNESSKLLWDGKSIGSGSTVGAFINDDTASIDTVYSSLKINSLIDGFQKKLSYSPENSANKGLPNGYTPLNSLGKIDSKYIPLISFTVNSLSAMNGIPSPQNGNICYIASTTEFYIYNGGWKFIAKGNAAVAGHNNLDAARNPLSSDDETQGYVKGNIWINSASMKAYICTNSEPGNATWELMAGSTILNISEIIPIRLNPENLISENGKSKFIISKTNYDPLSDYVELSINGIELDMEKEYEMIEEEMNTVVYINKEVLPSDVIIGEIFKNNLGTATEQMMKYDYDSNGNGKVDYAEFADIAKTFEPFYPNKSYYKDQLIVNNNRLLMAKNNFMTTDTFNEVDWVSIEAKPNSLNGFTTADLNEDSTKKFVSSDNLTDISKIKSIVTNLSTHSNNISKLEDRTTETENQIKSTSQAIQNLKLKDLFDTPNVYTAGATVRINDLGTGVVFDSNPAYAISKITDSNSNTYSKVSNPVFRNMLMTEHNEELGYHEFTLDAVTTDLRDMPSIFEHGKILACDANSNKYVLADAEELTMSKENFTKIIATNDWVLNEEAYELIVNHKLSSKALIVAIIDNNNKSVKEFEYIVNDDQNIKIVSTKPINGTIIINCSLGVSNGYWANALDLSNLQFVDDIVVREDRGYSSKKTLELLAPFAKKEDYHNKMSSDLLYAKKDSEHYHLNISTLNKITVNNLGEILYDGKKLLTSVEAKTIVLKDKSETLDFQEVFNSLEDVVTGTIVASELLIKNTGDKPLGLIIHDEEYELINIELLPNDTQKYQLGISKGTRVQLKGKYEYKITVSTL